MCVCVCVKKKKKKQNKKEKKKKRQVKRGDRTRNDSLAVHMGAGKELQLAEETYSDCSKEDNWGCLNDASCKHHRYYFTTRLDKVLADLFCSAPRYSSGATHVSPCRYE